MGESCRPVVRHRRRNARGARSSGRWGQTLAPSADSHDRHPPCSPPYSSASRSHCPARSSRACTPRQHARSSISTVDQGSRSLDWGCCSSACSRTGCCPGRIFSNGASGLRWRSQITGPSRHSPLALACSFKWCLFGVPRESFPDDVSSGSEEVIHEQPSKVQVRATLGIP